MVKYLIDKISNKQQKNWTVNLLYKFLKTKDLLYKSHKDKRPIVQKS